MERKKSGCSRFRLEGSELDSRNEYIRRALELAEENALGETFPNPLVGAVVVSGGEIVGEGYHQGPGRPHAEIEAIRDAGDRARGASALSQSRAVLPLRANASLHGRHRRRGNIARRFQHVRSRQPRARQRRRRAQGARHRGQGGGVRPGGARAQSPVRSPEPHGKAVRHAQARLDPRRKAHLGRRSGLSGERSSVHSPPAGLDGRRSRSGSARSRSTARSSTGGSSGGRCARRCGWSSIRRSVPRGLSVARPQGASHHLCLTNVDPIRRRELETAGAEVVPLPRGPHGVDLRFWIEDVLAKGITSVIVEGGGEVATAFLENGSRASRALLRAARLGTERRRLVPGRPRAALARAGELALRAARPWMTISCSCTIRAGSAIISPR